MPTVSSVLTDYGLLSITEQNQIKLILISPTFSGGLEVNKYVENKRFSNGRVCPHCGGTHIRKNGHRKDGVQRYICCDCNKSFVLSACSIAYGTRKSLHTWEKYIECMLNSFSIRKTAKICNIHQDTAFIWRKKYLMH